MKRLVPLALAVLLLVSLSAVFGCRSGGASPSNIVPQNATFVANIQVNRILSDPDLIAAYDAWEKDPETPQTFEELMLQIEEESGIDPRDFSEATVFGDSNEPEGYFGIILEGSFSEDTLITGIEYALGHMTPTTYNGHLVYEGEYEGSPTGLCLLSADTVLGGTLEAVKDAIDVVEGVPPLSGMVYDAYVALGDVWVKAAVEVPQEETTEIPEDIGIGEEFSEMEVAGLGFNKTGQNLCLDARLGFTSNEAAVDAEEALNAIMGLVAVFAPPEAEVFSEVLDGLCVDRSGVWVTVCLQTTIAELEELAEALEEMEEEDM